MFKRAFLHLRINKFNANMVKYLQVNALCFISYPIYIYPYFIRFDLFATNVLVTPNSNLLMNRKQTFHF